MNYFKKIVSNNILTIIFSTFLVLLVVFSKPSLLACKNGINIWAQSVVPALFPFFIATELLNYTSLPALLGKLTNKLMRPLFNVPGEASYAFVMGILSGYPIGAKIVNVFFEKGICTKDEAERMLAFTNNSGPLFIIGTLGINLFGSSEIGIALFLTHILASITVGVILGFISRIHFKKYGNSSRYIRKLQPHNPEMKYTLKDLGTILSSSITGATSTVFLVGGFIVLFSIIISILQELNVVSTISNFLGLSSFFTDKRLTSGLLYGIIELTNGLSFITSIRTKYISSQILCSSFVLGFAGISILLQVLSIASKNKLSIKYYLVGKILQGTFAVLYTFIFIRFFSFLSLDLIPIK